MRINTIINTIINPISKTFAFGKKIYHSDYFFWLLGILLVGVFLIWNEIDNFQKEKQIQIERTQRKERLRPLCAEQIFLMPDNEKRIETAIKCRKESFVVDKSPYEVFRESCHNGNLLGDNERRVALARACRKDGFLVNKTLYELQYEANEKQDQQVRQNQTIISNQQKQINVLQQELNKKPANN